MKCASEKSTVEATSPTRFCRNERKKNSSIVIADRMISAFFQIARLAIQPIIAGGSGG